MQLLLYQWVDFIGSKALKTNFKGQKMAILSVILIAAGVSMIITGMKIA